ncbi:hypothetical protein JBE27_35400 [Streptomyces albiflaviniger]|nr:hypothetical protein [Streptomyces albiflaviniger]
MADTKEQRYVERLTGLLREMRRQMARDAEPDVREVLDWLHRQTGAGIGLVVDDEGTVESSTTGFPREILRPLAPLLAR